MLSKILGIILIVIGGSLALGVLFQLIGSIVGLLWAMIKLAIPLVLLYVGYRLLTREPDY
jgi:hypothetical protein